MERPHPSWQASSSVLPLFALLLAAVAVNPAGGDDQPNEGVHLLQGTKRRGVVILAVTTLCNSYDLEEWAIYLLASPMSQSAATACCVMEAVIGLGTT